MGTSFKSLPNIVDFDRLHREAVAQMGDNTDARATLGGGGRGRAIRFRQRRFLEGGLGGKQQGDSADHEEFLSSPQAGEYALERGLASCIKKISTNRRGGSRGRTDRNPTIYAILTISAQHRGFLPRGSNHGLPIAARHHRADCLGHDLSDHEHLHQRRSAGVLRRRRGVGLRRPDLLSAICTSCGAKRMRTLRMRSPAHARLLGTSNRSHALGAPCPVRRRARRGSSRGCGRRRPQSRSAARSPCLPA